MTLIKKTKTKIKLALRKLGFLCKKYQPLKKGVRISKTRMPDGSEIYHGGFVEKAPINNQSFESELHVYHEIKDLVKFNKTIKNK